MNSDLILEAKRLGKCYRQSSSRRSLREGLWQALWGKRKDKEIWALRDVDLQVRRGDRVAILGRNGAGKSTLLRLLSGISRPSSGTVQVFGKAIAIFQNGLGFHPELTGRENLFMGGAAYGADADFVEQKLPEILAFAELEEFVDVPLRQYSLGMWSRLGFALALHLPAADLYLIDEALGAGDHFFLEKCKEALNDRLSEGASWIVVSHNMESLIDLCEKTFLISSGMIVAEGETQAIIDQYKALSE